jgi:RNA polymerase sigma factor (sigma-70 family)
MPPDSQAPDSQAPAASAARHPQHPLPGTPATPAGQDPGTPPAQLVRLAAAGNQRAWERLVDRYSRLIATITGQFGLTGDDAADIAQTTWLRLAGHIGRIEHPERAGSWLATTTRNECLRLLAARKKQALARQALLSAGPPGQGPAADEALLAAARAREVRAAMALLPHRWQRLLEMLTADPPAPYAVISAELSLPPGSIGPTRARCLARLRTLLEAS